METEYALHELYNKNNRDIRKLYMYLKKYLCNFSKVKQNLFSHTIDIATIKNLNNILKFEHRLELFN